MAEQTRQTISRRFLKRETSGGAVLLAAAVVALLWANSPLSASYLSLWHTDVVLHEDLQHWVNDALMAVFFLVVGLEIKRELVHGVLRDPRTAALPVIAAMGGMIVPAALFLIVNAGGEGSGGWAVPMATDIAFAIGVVTLLGPRVPVSLKVFLLTLAIVDDVGAIVVIGVFYAAGLRPGFLAVAAAVAVVLALVNRAGVGGLFPYVILGVLLWAATYASGVHATLAGVVLGMLVPARLGDGLHRALHPWSTFLVVPLFALANAGVMVEAGAYDTPGAVAVTAGVVLGLVVGKTLGIAGAAWLATRAGVGRLPEGASWPMLVGVAAVGGVGFTVSLFIAELAFDTAPLHDAAKLGILAASTVAAVLGGTGLRRACRPRGPVPV